MSNQPQHTPCPQILKRRADGMDADSLLWSANDASEAAEMAEALEREGCRVSKTSGYYRDEATFYRAEWRKRQSIREGSTDVASLASSVAIQLNQSCSANVAGFDVRHALHAALGTSTNRELAEKLSRIS